MAEITGGAVGVTVFRAKAGAKGNGIPWHWHELGLHVSYVLKGWALYEFEGVGEVRVNAGDFMYQPPFNRHRELEQSEDFEAMEFTLPATFESMMMYYEPEKDSWRTEAVRI
jgi:quercetin dioxygenase-like cupin family protein